jgi:peptidoglycan biosynthesis protein MviN/MurJ (putative lipid II flippase)
MGISVAEMVSIGLTALASRRHGERRPDLAARAAGDALVLAVGLGVAAALAGEAFAGGMLALMHTPADVAAVGRDYLRVYVLGAPVLYGYFVVDATFRAAGDTRTPFVVLLASVAVGLAARPAAHPRRGRAAGARACAARRSPPRSPAGTACVVGFALLRRRGLLRFGRPARGGARHDLARRAPTAATGRAVQLVYV